jgi:hypothetical protein
MAKIQIIPKQLTDKEELEKITQETLAIAKKNDKELNEDEKLAMRNAEVLNSQDFPLIFPMRATIGFMVRNMDGKNQQAIEFLRATVSQTTGKTNRIVHLINEFDKLDEDSKNRVDCLDWLARRNNLTIPLMLEYLSEGIILFQNHMTKIIIASKKTDLASKIFKSAENESLKSHHHKKLAAQVAGLIDDKPLVSVETGNKTTVNNTTNNILVPNFADWQKQNDKVIRGEIGPKEPDYVEGEVVE